MDTRDRWLSVLVLLNVTLLLLHFQERYAVNFSFGNIGEGFGEIQITDTVYTQLSNDAAVIDSTFTNVTSLEATGDTTDNIFDLIPPNDMWPTHSSARVAILIATAGPKYEKTGSADKDSIATHCWKNKQLYARVHGYDAINFDLTYFKKKSRSPITGRPRLLVWAKNAVMRGCLDRYNMCGWFDTDVVITNMSISVESFFEEGKVAMGHDVGMVIGKSYELLDMHDPRVESQSGYRLNTGIFFLRSTEWAKDFIERGWRMDGVDTDGQKAYIEGFNRGQSMMQFYIKHNPIDAANTYFPPHQAINIHNSLSGPEDKWKPGMFLVHYYGGFQGCKPRPITKPNRNPCYDEFIEHCFRSAATVSPRHRLAVYSDWFTNQERIAMKIGPL